MFKLKRNTTQDSTDFEYWNRDTLHGMTLQNKKTQLDLKDTKDI